MNISKMHFKQFPEIDNFHGTGNRHFLYWQVGQKRCVYSKVYTSIVLFVFAKSTSLHICCITV